MKNVFDTLINTETSSILDDNSSWNNVLSKLKPHQKQELLASINQFLSNNKITPFTKTDLSCPSCSSKTFVKNGLFGSKQRYKCKGCSYSFSSTSDTSIMLLIFDIFKCFIIYFLNEFDTTIN
jgi:transposase-like protein